MWQLTAVDVATRIAVVQRVVGDKNAAIVGAFLTHLKKALRRHGTTLEGVLTDNGPEFTGKDFTAAREALGLTHHRIPPRSPNHNAVCERFHGTVLNEFYRPHFHRGRVDDLTLLDQALQAWINDLQPPPPQPRPLHGRTHPSPSQNQLRRRTRRTTA